MSGYEMVEEAELHAAILRAVRDTLLIVAALVCAGMGIGYAAAIGFTDLLSPWPAVGWLLLAQAIVIVEKYLSRPTPPRAPQEKA